MRRTYLNPKIKDGVLLRQKYFVGKEAGEQIVQEAREIYYRENRFTI